MTISASESDHAAEPDTAGLGVFWDAVGPLMTTGQRLLVALLVAHRIPAVGPLVDAVRRVQTGDRAGATVLPLVSPAKTNC